MILLFQGPPQIISSSKQSGVVGENVHINCAAITIPQPKNDEIVWMYHESKISEGTLILNNIDTSGTYRAEIQLYLKLKY